MSFYNLYKLSSFFLILFGIMFICLSFFFLIYYDFFLFFDWEFFSFNSCFMTLTFFFDWMSLMFVGCVFLISSMVIFYSFSYMSQDNNFFWFCFLVLLFIFSMFMIIVSPNMISILLGWDGLGLVSYCLLIYFQNYNSYNAGLLTVLTNRMA